MNPNVECEDIDFKHEDLLLISEIKSERHDIKYEVEIKAEESVVNDEAYQNLHLITSSQNVSEVENTQGNLEKKFEGFIGKPKDEKSDINEGEILGQFVSHDSCEYNLTHLQEDKSNVDICGDMQGNANTHRVNNSVVKYSDTDVHTPATNIHLKCSVCNKLHIKNTINEYEDVLAVEEPFTCNFCRNSFTRKCYLSENTHNNTNVNLLQCNVCTRTFSHRKYLLRHTRTHANQRRFVCNVCMKCFSEKHHLNEHIRIHKNEKPFTCEICTKSFTRKSTLTNHIRTHTNEKPFKCNICTRSYSRSHLLIEHKRTHTNEKPFTCNICNRAFGRKSQLVEHTRAHTNEKPFTCNICMKFFNSRSHLSSHTTVHTNVKPFTCNLCMKSFARRNDLLRHINTEMKNSSHVK